MVVNDNKFSENTDLEPSSSSFADLMANEDEDCDLIQDEDEELFLSSLSDSTDNLTDADGNPLFEHYRIVADPKQSPLRVDKFLMNHMNKTTRNRLQQAAEAGCIFVGNKPIKSNYKVKPGDIITLQLRRPKRLFEVTAENIPLDIVYEDDFLLVVNKPAGMVVHPGHGNYSGTLVNALAYHLRNNPQYDPSDPRLGLVHRIDKDTSGLLVVAKTPEAKADLSRQFFEKSTERTYRALVWGRFDPKEGTIKGNIGRDPKDRLIMKVFPYMSEYGKDAVTHYTCLEEFAYVSWIECRLETGRTHQIRAHMKSIDHPLFADERYGGDKILRGNNSGSYKQFIHNCLELCPRQCLHAKTLGFTHPYSGQKMKFDSEIPQDLNALLEKWRTYTANLSDR
ncbi:pseudouridine synthase [Porphyromonas macacae]|uniref:Pseudouridine synthase n=2 Tax=Porphyromonas macacae TaxID=28115 RepID=A0A0A2E678_9PORP|nr:RluA family pseudouridine synthase [Porphyromonas macacae]KGN72935.1 pseudouridine synthase [Porphyromonas macacae]